MTVTNRKWIQTKKTQLYTSIGTSTNSILLKNCFKLNGAELDMEDDFGTLGYMTLEPGGLKEEIISFTGLSYNVSGTICTITGVTRGLSGNSAYGSGGTAYGHSANRVAIFTNNPQHYNGFANKYNDETIERIWTFTTATRPKLTTDSDALLAEELVTLGQVNRLIQATYLPPQVVATATGTTGTSQTATLTYALTIPASATDRALYVEINSEENKTISTVTWGGVALTQVATETRATGNIRVEIWRLTAPATGTANIVITPSANAYITSHATAFSSVNQSTPGDAISTGSDGSGTAVSDSITTITQGAIILASVGTALDPTTFTPTAPLSEQAVNSSGTNRPLSTSLRSTTTAGVYSPAYTITSTNYCIKAVAIRGVAVPGIAGVSSVTGTYINTTDPANPVSVVPKNNSTNTTPTVNDDSADGYAVDSKWFNTVTGYLYTCTDATVGAAVWTQIKVSVDGTTVTGDGTVGNPLVSVVGDKFIGVGGISNINWFNGELSFVQLDGGADAWTIANPSGVLTESKTDLTTNTTCSIENWCVDWATGGVLNFNSGKQVIVQGIVVYDAVDDKCGWGFGDAIWNCQGAPNNNFGFVTDASGAFYTYTGAVGGVTYTETPITSLSSGTHVLRIEVDPANATPQIRFYVDGVLVSTHTTNVATTEPLDFSLGNSGGAMNGILAVSSPTFAVEI